MPSIRHHNSGCPRAFRPFTLGERGGGGPGGNHEEHCYLPQGVSWGTEPIAGEPECWLRWRRLAATVEASLSQHGGRKRG